MCEFEVPRYVCYKFLLEKKCTQSMFFAVRISLKNQLSDIKFASVLRQFQAPCHNKLLNFMF